MRIISVVVLLCVVSGCTPRAARDIVRDNHAISAVFSKRIDTDKRPTQSELENFAKLTAKAWAEMDKMVNNWREPAP